MRPTSLVPSSVSSERGTRLTKRTSYRSGVADGYRRRGIGELLLIAAVEHAVARETETITLEVRKSNAAARTLYEKYGFVEQGIRKAYYSDNREDAVIMTKGSIQMERYAAQVAALKQAHQERWGRAEIDVGT